MFEKKLTEAEKALVVEAKQEAAKCLHAAEVTKNRGLQVINQKKSDMLNGLISIINRCSK